MPRKGLKVSVDLRIHMVSCPGVVLKDRSDIYLSFCVLGHHRHTISIPAVFPLFFNQRFHLEKTYYGASDLVVLGDYLEDDHVLVEMIQRTPFYPGGVVLASYDSSAQDFLFPQPSLSPVYGTQEREVLMLRTMHFDGISPKVEFSTRTTVEEFPASPLDELDDYLNKDIGGKYFVSELGDSKRPSRDAVFERSRRRSRHRSGESSGVDKPKSSSRSRSLSPRKLRGDAERPPFVIRRVDNPTKYPHSLTDDIHHHAGRVCDFHSGETRAERGRQRSRKRNDSRSRSGVNEAYRRHTGRDYYGSGTKVVREPVDDEFYQLPEHLGAASGVSEVPSTADIEAKISEINKRLRKRTFVPSSYIPHSPIRSPARSPIRSISPLYRPRYYYYDYPYSTYWRIHDRVERALLDAKLRRSVYSPPLYDTPLPTGSDTGLSSSYDSLSDPYGVERRSALLDDDLDRIYGRLHRRVNRHYYY